MIRKLRRHFTFLVWITLLLIMIGVVASINILNWHSLSNQAESALDTLMAQNGVRPSPNQPGNNAPAAQPKGTPPPAEKKSGASYPAGSTPPPVDENGAALGESTEETLPHNDTGSAPNPDNMPMNPNPAQNPDISDMKRNPLPNPGQASVNLSNYYSVQIGKDGTVSSWTSDRMDLYTDEDVSGFTAQVVAAGKTFGQIGTQFYYLQEKPYGQLLIVLDMQLEIINANILLRNTILIGLATWLILSAGAFFLIRRLIRPVQEAFDRQRQFVWDASHELKTPLAVISANADALSKDIGSNDWLNYIHDEIDRASRMINNMLTLAQIDQGAIRAQMAPFDLSRTADRILLSFESVIFEAGEMLVADIPDQISYVGDESMIGQLLTILLGNAVKYTEKGGTITVRLKSSGHRCILTVHNTGESISLRDQEHLFERFYRADVSHNSGTEGSGLGLAIAKSLTEAHKGQISVSCPAEGGTLFTVILP